MKKQFIALIAMLFCVHSGAQNLGQVNLSDMGLSSSDSLQKSSIRYFSPGKGGRNRVWDFSRKLSSKGSSQVMFEKDNTGLVTVNEPEKISSYLIHPDVISMNRSESSRELRNYPIEKLITSLSLQYGDSLSQPFTCEGIYCGDHFFRESGTTSTKVDAIGTVVLAENATIENVRRVHTISSYSVCMDMESAALDTAQLRQVIEERYEWYVPGSQYPIIENVTSTSYLNMDPLGTTRYAYCNLQESDACYYITEDDSDDSEDDGSFDEEQANQDMLHYTFEARDGQIRISYDLDGDATINAIVASKMGITYIHRTWSQPAGQGYTAQIDCTGLPSGTYILYINVNGKVYSNKVTL